MTSSFVPVYAPSAAKFGVVGQNSLGLMQDIERPSLCGRGVILRDIAAQTSEIVDRFSRRCDVHIIEGLRDRLLVLTIPIVHTFSCETASPRSSEAMTSLVPETCVSFTCNGYSSMASLTRTELLRPTILASFFSRCLIAVLTLTVNFADSVLLISIRFIVPYWRIRAMVVGIR